MQRIWLRQLQLEFEEICFSYGVDLQPPIFEISESTREFGSWCQDTGTLRLSRHLIENYSWAVTLMLRACRRVALARMRLVSAIA